MARSDLDGPVPRPVERCSCDESLRLRTALESVERWLKKSADDIFHDGYYDAHDVLKQVRKALG